MHDGSLGLLAHPQAPAMRLDDGAAKSKAYAQAVGLGGCEGHEGRIKLLLLEARPVVVHPHLDEASFAWNCLDEHVSPVHFALR